MNLKGDCNGYDEMPMFIVIASIEDFIWLVFEVILRKQIANDWFDQRRFCVFINVMIQQTR